MEVLKVIHKPSGEERTIKAFRFNPELHVKLENFVDQKLDTEEKTVHNDGEKPLNMHEVRSMAKEMGIKTSPTDKRVDILAKIKEHQAIVASDVEAANATNP